ILGIKCLAEIDIASQVTLRLGSCDQRQRDRGHPRGRRTEQFGDPPARHAANMQRAIKFSEACRYHYRLLYGITKQAQGARAPAPLHCGNESRQPGSGVALHGANSATTRAAAIWPGFPPPKTK